MRHEDKAWNETFKLIRAGIGYCRGDDYPRGDDICLPTGLAHFLSCEISAREKSPSVTEHYAYYGVRKQRDLTFVDCQNNDNYLLSFDFDRCKFIKGSFAGNEVRGCSFRDSRFETDMTGTTFHYGNLSGANLTGSTGAVTFKGSNITDVIMDAQQALESTFENCKGAKNLVLMLGDKVVTDYAIDANGKIVPQIEEDASSLVRITRKFIDKAVGAPKEISLAQAYKSGLIAVPALLTTDAQVSADKPELVAA